MTHRDGFPRLSARSAWRGDAGHRKPCARSKALGRRKALTMPRRTRGFPPTRPLARRIACPISIGHYQRSLVLSVFAKEKRDADGETSNGIAPRY